MRKRAARSIPFTPRSTTITASAIARACVRIGHPEPMKPSQYSCGPTQVAAPASQGAVGTVWVTAPNRYRSVHPITTV